MEVDEEDTWTERLRFSVLLRVRHPSLKPDEISKGLNLSPDHSRCVGEQRKTPAGTLLKGFYEMTLWTAGEDAVQTKNFFEHVLKFADRLEKFEGFVTQVFDTGGSINIYVQLPGDVNIGSTMSVEGMSRLARLRVTLGLEVFPHMSDLKPYDMVSYQEPDNAPSPT